MHVDISVGVTFLIPIIWSKGKHIENFVAEEAATSAFRIKFGTRTLPTLGAEIAGDVFIMACSHCSRNGILFEVVKKKMLQNLWKHKLPGYLWKGCSGDEGPQAAALLCSALNDTSL